MQQLSDLLQAIEMCLEKKLITPSLILIYSGIDIMASLERSTDEKIKKSFTKWVENYMLKSRPLPCNAIELYAARCGILHSFTADSDLSRENKARRIIYAWGTADTKDLQEANNRLPTPDDVALHISDLVESFKFGISKYFDELKTYPEREKRVLRQSNNWFTDLRKETLKDFLDIDRINPK